MKPTVTTTAPIPGWDCTETTGSGEITFACSPSDEWIRKAAYFLWVKGSEKSAEENWYTAEDELVFAWEEETGVS